MFKKILFILILPFFLYAQWTDPRPKSIQLWHLNTSFFDSLGNVVRDSVASLSADGVTILNSGTLKQRVFADTSSFTAPDSIGSIVNLKQLSSTNANGGGQFIFRPSGYSADGGSVFPVTGGYLVRLTLYRNGVLNAKDYGLSTSNNAATNDAALSNLFNSALNVYTDSVKIYIPDGHYRVSSTVLIGQASEGNVIIEGGSRTTFKMTTNDTLFRIKNFTTELTMRNLRLIGNGKASSSVLVGVGTAANGRLQFDHVIFDSSGIGLDIYDCTGLLTLESTWRQCGVGYKSGYNSDGHQNIQPNFIRNDTCVVIYGSSNDGVTFQGGSFGINGVCFVNRGGGGGFNIRDNYFEDNTHIALIGTDDGNAASQQRVHTIIGNYGQGDGAANSASGWTFYDNDVVTFIGNQWTGACDTNFINFYGTGARLITGNNLMSGTNQNYRLGNDNLIYAGDLSLNYNSKKAFRYSANSLSASDAGIENEFYSAPGDRWLERWRITGSTNRTTAWSAGVRTLTNAIVMGLGEGAGFINFSSGQTGLPATASSSYRGFAYYRENSSTIDELVVSSRIPGGTYQWVDLYTGTYLGEGDAMGSASFTTSDLHDTVVVSGLSSGSDYVTITPLTDSPVADTYSYTLGTDTLFVHRTSATPSGLTYTWQRRKAVLK